MVGYFVLWLMFTGVGMGTEAFFTGSKRLIKSLLAGRTIHWHLLCRTHLWSFFTFGLSATVSFTLAWDSVVSWLWLARGLAGAPIIVLWELLWATILKLIFGFVPWNYGPGWWTLGGRVNLKLLPFWFVYYYLMEAAYRIYLVAAAGNFGW